MIRVMQTISAPENKEEPAKSGNCLQAATASILEIPLDDVPHFLSFGNLWWEKYCEYFFSIGYRVVKYISNPRRLGYLGEDEFNIIQDMPGINGYFMGTVLSPRFYNFDNLHATHAVIIDKDYNIVHDPYYPPETVYPHADRLGYNGIVGIDIIEKI